MRFRTPSVLALLPLALLAPTFVHAQASPWTGHGQALGTRKARPFAEVLKAADEWDGRKVVVEGTVAEVADDGAWLLLVDGDQELWVTMEGFAVPSDIQGATVQVQGIFDDEASADRAREVLEAGGRADEAARVEGPTAIFTLRAKGVKLRRDAAGS